jgi:hypothetical protein
MSSRVRFIGHAQHCRVGRASERARAAGPPVFERTKRGAVSLSLRLAGTTRSCRAPHQLTAAQKHLCIQ